MGRRRGSTAMNSLYGWARKQSKKVQASLAAMIVVVTLVLLHFFFHVDYFYLASQITYTIGLLVLGYKLTTQKNCSGLSLRTQEATAIYLAVRLVVGIESEMELDIHIFLDSVSLMSTLWVIYMMRFKLQSSYIKEFDSIPIYYLVIPCFILAVCINPSSSMSFFPSIISVLWAFCTYTESISVLPQLRFIQNAKMVEPVTAHYVFALGVSRLFGFAHWAYFIYETKGQHFLPMIGGHYYFWIPAQLLAEVVQTFILADFCYYYIRSVLRGQKMVLPSV